MFLVIHNLPTDIRYQDIKLLIQSKCGLSEVILDNLVSDGRNTKVTVGLADESDAAILVRKINGLFIDGQQLYVENAKLKKASEQPYRSTKTFQQKPPKDMYPDEIESTSFINTPYQQDPMPQSSAMYTHNEQGTYNPSQGLYNPNGQVLWDQAAMMVPMGMGGMGAPNMNVMYVPSMAAPTPFMGFGSQVRSQSDVPRQVEPPAPRRAVPPGDDREWGSGYGRARNEPVAQYEAGARRGPSPPRRGPDSRWGGPARASRWAEPEEPAPDPRDRPYPREPYSYAAEQQPQPAYSQPRRDTFAPTAFGDSPPHRKAHEFDIRGPSPEYQADPNRSIDPWEKPSHFGTRKFDEHSPDTKFMRNESQRFDRDPQPWQQEDSDIQRPPRQNLRYDDEKPFSGQAGRFPKQEPIATRFHEQHPGIKSKWSPREDPMGQSFPGGNKKRPLAPAAQTGPRNKVFGARPSGEEPPSKRFAGRARADYARPMAQGRPVGLAHPVHQPRPMGPGRSVGQVRPMGPGRSVGQVRPVGPPRSVGQVRPVGPPRSVGQVRPVGPPRSAGQAHPMGQPRPTGPPRPAAKPFPKGPNSKPAPNGKDKKPRNLTNLVAREHTWCGQAAAVIAKEMLKKVGTESLPPRDPLALALKRSIRARIDMQIAGSKRRPAEMADIVTLYRARFAPSTDTDFYAAVKKSVDEGLAENGDTPNKPAGIKPEAVKTESKPAPSENPAKKVKLEPAAATTAATPSDRLPKHPFADKKVTKSEVGAADRPLFPSALPHIHVKDNSRSRRYIRRHAHDIGQKQIMKTETAESYELEPELQKALDEHADQLCDVFMGECEDPADENERQVCERISDHVSDEFRKVVRLLVTKRIKDVKTALLVRVLFVKAPPPLEKLTAFMKQYGALSLSKSARKKLYVVNCDSYDNYDKLCQMETVQIGGVDVMLKPMYITGPGAKLNRTQVLAQRQQYILNQIDRGSFLDKVQYPLPTRLQGKKRPAETVTSETIAKTETEDNNAETETNDAKTEYKDEVTNYGNAQDDTDFTIDNMDFAEDEQYVNADGKLVNLGEAYQEFEDCIAANKAENNAADVDLDSLNDDDLEEW